MKSKWLVRISGYIPIILLAVITYAAIFDTPNELLQILCIHFGSSTTSLLFMFLTVFNKRMRFCLIAKISTVTLMFNHFLYIIGDYIYYNIYMETLTVLYVLAPAL